MQVLRDREEEFEVAPWIRRLAALARRGDALSMLVELGMLEQAVLDVRAFRSDTFGPLERELGAAVMAAGAACLGECSGSARAAALLDTIAPRLPARVRARTPEGFLHYALDPFAYECAARSYAREVGAARARRAVVLGVRSIGTSLSAIVAAAIEARERFTLRPRGASGSRVMAADSSIASVLAASAGDVLVVDEGPGVTGETFECVARWLIALGIEQDRIRLLPSHDGPPALAPDSRRSFLTSLRMHAPPSTDARLARIAAACGLELGADLGGGAWRALTGATSAPSRGLFERRKILARSASGRRLLLRWAGLGGAAERALELVAALAEDGSCEAPIALREGFALWPWIDGRPHSRRRASPSLLATIARYLSRREMLARTGQSTNREPIVAMLAENAREAGYDASAATRLVMALPEREAIIADGRLAPWEWLRTRDGWKKVDAADHGDGVHLPGPIDSAWDVAGAWIEYDLDERAAAMLAPDAPALAAARAYLAPYAAFAFGDAVLTARTAPPEDRAILRQEAAFFRRALARALERADALASRPTYSIPSRSA